MKKVIALFLSLSFIFALVPAMTLSISADTFNANDPKTWPYIEFTSNQPFSIRFPDDKGLECNAGGPWAGGGPSYLNAGKDGDTYWLILRGNTSAINNTITISGTNVSVAGNIMSLLSYTNLNVGLKQNSFSCLFENQKALTDASNLYLPAQTLAQECYSMMFSGCKSLVKAPALSAATTLTKACYMSMFQDCTSLTAAPTLPAEQLAEGCYMGMFRNCTSLTKAPALPATTLCKECYMGMFYGCTSLIMVETNNASDAIWDFRNITTGTDWNSMMCSITVEAGHMYGYYTSTLVEEAESEPEADIEIGGMTKSVKYGNNAVVVDESLVNESIIDNNCVIDFSSANAKIDSVIVKNSVVKDLANNGYGIELVNKQGKVVVTNPDEELNNSVTIGLKQDTALYTQVKAMNTTHVESEVEVAYKSNGKSIDGDVKVYIPCDLKEARVFYVIDEHTIGEWQCEVVDGYCVFDRYKDGTYVVVK